MQFIDSIQSGYDWRTSRIVPALAISILVHGILIYAMGHVSSHLQLQLSLPTLAVTVVQQQAPEPTAEPPALPAVQPQQTSGIPPRIISKPAGARPHKPRPLKRQFPVTKKPVEPEKKQDMQTTEQLKPTAASTAAAHQIRPPSDQETLGTPQLESELKLQLRKYFYYPMLARKRGWEGSVLLGFEVQRNRPVFNISVLKSSGYEILDSSAVAALKKIKIDSNGPLRPAELQLPVQFRLH